MGELSPSLQNEDLELEPVNNGFEATIDWRNANIITSIKNQGRCGSCWAFAATAAHESYQVQNRHQSLKIDLSEQQLVDCATAEPYGNNGCNGGYAARALEYIKDFGQTIESEYPYAAVNQDCKNPKGSFRSYGFAELAGCDEIEYQLKSNPLAVRVDATNWKSYASGVFNNCESKLNHAVFMVGSSADAWTIKNSWSEAWGENGYIRLAKGNTCGVCVGPSFPV